MAQKVDHDEIIELINTGMSYYKIAEIYGVTHAAISYIGRKNGIYRGPTPKRDGSTTKRDRIDKYNPAWQEDFKKRWDSISCPIYRVLFPARWGEATDSAMRYLRDEQSKNELGKVH